MLILEIQENIIKAKNSLESMESDTVYKLYKTIGGRGKFENELRGIYNNLITLRNSFISHAEAIVRLSENKELLTLIDNGYFDKFSEAVSTESLIRIASFNSFEIPQTSVHVISENRNVTQELHAINGEIQTYNRLIADFRNNRNKYYITLYQVPDNNHLPDMITGSVDIEHILPDANVLSNYLRNKQMIEGKMPTIHVQPKAESNKPIQIVEKNPAKESPKIRITKRDNK